MNQNMKKRLSQFVLPAFLATATSGVGCSYKEEIISVDRYYYVGRDHYSVEYRDARFGKVAFTKVYCRGREKTKYVLLQLGNVGLFNAIKDSTGVALRDIEGDGLVDEIKDFDDRVSRSEARFIDDPQEKALFEERFAKADKILASFTSKRELVDLIKKAEAEWKENYKPKLPEGVQGDLLDKYLE